MEPIVTFKPAAGGLEALGDAPSADPEALAEFSRALQLLEQAQLRPGVMSTVEDPAVALLQTFIAEQAEQGKLSPAPGGALEAKFDERDLLGWAGSFFTFWRRLRPHKWLTAAGRVACGWSTCAAVPSLVLSLRHEAVGFARHHLRHESLRQLRHCCGGCL
jgi:hypothetical protein